MKGVFTGLGWILFLLVTLIGLLFYNLRYIPMEVKITQLQEEIAMWTQRVGELTDSLKHINKDSNALDNYSFRFDELFINPDSLSLSKEGEERLKAIVPQLRSSSGVIEIIGHSDSRRSPLPSLWPTGWEYSAAAAAAVTRSLVSFGIPPERLKVVGWADTKPRVSKSTSDASIFNRRVEILVRRR